MPLNSVCRLDVLDLGGQLLRLGDDRGLVVVAQRAVLVLHLQVTHALQHRVHLVEGTFRRLDERDAVLRVALRLSEAADLRAHLLRDGEAGRVVGGTVDAVAAATASPSPWRPWTPCRSVDGAR